VVGLRTLAVALALAVLHRHVHGPSFDYAGIALACAASWIGVPGPGEPVLIAAGVYAARGKVDIGDVLLVAWLAATAGGIAGWMLGRRGGRALWSAPGPLLRLRLAAMERGERFFDRHAWLGVYLAPSWVAGIHGLSAARFLPLNALCAAVWTLLCGLGAYLIGPSVADAVGDLGLAGAIALGLLVLIGVVGGRMRRRRRHAHRRV
jgi:membrane protein DedA with SNARE-associated domain